MKLIHVPMQKHNEVKCLSGKKIATTRWNKLGEPGDFFMLGNYYFEIIAVVKMRLGDIAQYFYRQEGFDSPQEFIREWGVLHYVIGYIPSYQAYFHIFKKRY